MNTFLPHRFVDVDVSNDDATDKELSFTIEREFPIVDQPRQYDLVFSRFLIPSSTIEPYAAKGKSNIAMAVNGEQIGIRFDNSMRPLRNSGVNHDMIQPQFKLENVQSNRIQSQFDLVDELNNALQRAWYALHTNFSRPEGVPDQPGDQGTENGYNIIPPWIEKIETSDHVLTFGASTVNGPSIDNNTLYLGEQNPLSNTSGDITNGHVAFELRLYGSYDFNTANQLAGPTGYHHDIWLVAPSANGVDAITHAIPVATNVKFEVDTLQEFDIRFADRYDASKLSNKRISGPDAGENGLMEIRYFQPEVPFSTLHEFIQTIPHSDPNNNQWRVKVVPSSRDIHDFTRTYPDALIKFDVNADFSRIEIKKATPWSFGYSNYPYYAPFFSLEDNELRLHYSDQFSVTGLTVVMTPALSNILGMPSKSFQTPEAVGFIFPDQISWTPEVSTAIKNLKEIELPSVIMTPSLVDIPNPSPYSNLVFKNIRHVSQTRKSVVNLQHDLYKFTFETNLPLVNEVRGDTYNETQNTLTDFIIGDFDSEYYLFSDDKVSSRRYRMITQDSLNSFTFKCVLERQNGEKENVFIAPGTRANVRIAFIPIEK